MKERGCVWLGTLEQLDTHMDPDQDDCQYVDTVCPLNCQQTISKNNMDDHLAQYCVKRAYSCQYCSFKATYEEVVDMHLPQCKYVPLDCPNRCGVTFERDFLEDHMKMCRLEEVACGFRGVGCDDRFLQEDRESHTRENSDKHLILTASLAVACKDNLEKRLLEQDERHKEEEKKLMGKVKKQEQQLTEQQLQLFDQQQQITEQQQQIHKHQLINEQQEEMNKQQQQQITQQQQQINEQQQQISKQQSKVNQTEEDNLSLRKQLQGHEKKFAEVETSIELSVKSLEQKFWQSLYAAGLKHSFVMRNFSREKLKDESGSWKSPAMYTHTRGYKFCIGVDANGSGSRHGESINVEMWAMPGKYDYLLKWPAEVSFTMEVINQCGGGNVVLRSTCNWDKPCKDKFVSNFIGGKSYFTLAGSRFPYVGTIRHSDIRNYLTEDSLHFNIPHITVMSS